MKHSRLLRCAIGVAKEVHIRTLVLDGAALNRRLLITSHLILPELLIPVSVWPSTMKFYDLSNTQDVITTHPW